MKNYFLYLFTLLFMFTVSCSEGEDIGSDNPSKQPDIKVEATMSDFATEGGTNTISFTSSAAWTAEIINSRADSWCSINPTSGPAGKAQITITTTANETPDDRTASIIIKSGTVSKTINVSQKQKDALTVTSSKFEVSDEGGKVNIEVKSNIEFEYAIEESAKDWITYIESRALTASTLVFDVYKNESVQKREAKITFKSGELNETVTVYQAGASPSIILSTNNIAIPSTEATIAVEVKSNVDVTVVMPEATDWVTMNSSRAYSTNTYYFDIKQNDGYDNRTAEIKFVNNENDMSESVIVTQMQLDAIVVANSEYTFGSEGGELDFEIMANVNFTVDISDNAKDWITEVQSRALQATTLHFDIAKSNDGNYREGTITISGGVATQTIKVKQEMVNIDPEAIPSNEVWYKTIDGKKIDFSKVPGEPFDRQIVSHTYEMGIGKILFDGPVKTVNKLDYAGSNKLSELYLPDDIETINAYAVNSEILSVVRVPKNLKSYGQNALYGAKLASFIGHNISEDGRCLVINGILYKLAVEGLKEYTFPDNIVEISPYAIGRLEDLEVIQFNEGLKLLDNESISSCPGLKKVIFSSTIEKILSYNFYGCNNIEGFYGNEKFHTPDNICFIRINEISGIVELAKFANAGLEEYTIPEGIQQLNNYVFHNNNDIKKLTLANTLVTIAPEAIYNCPNLEGIYGPYTSSDHRSIVRDGELIRMVVTKDMPADYHIPDDITAIGYLAFGNNDKIVNVTMGDQVTILGGYAFSECPNLKSVKLSGGIKKIGTDGLGYNPFLKSYGLEAVYFRSYLPPNYLDPQMSEFPNLKVYVPSQSLDFYKNDNGWQTFKDYMEPYDCENPVMPDFYVSTDYSKNGESTLIQQASEGKGINLVLMGDGYSDRQIESGLYHEDMEIAADLFFDIEPYKSFRHLFNVYVVTAVSATEGIGNGPTAFTTYYSGRAALGYDPLVMEYTKNIVGEELMEETMSVVMMNEEKIYLSAGVCSSYYPSYETDYGSGFSISYFPTTDRGNTLASLIQHETGGHGFAKLADEYYFDGRIPLEIQQKAEMEITKYGWWKNIDFTNNPATIKWSHLLSDSRYENEGLGIYEGGFEYANGVWSPTTSSMMSTMQDGFNAPSREAIYYRLHKLAYGEEWQYDYEKFVEWDAKNRTTSTESRSTSYRLNNRNIQTTCPPIIHKKTWKEAMAEQK